MSNKEICHCACSSATFAKHESWNHLKCCLRNKCSTKNVKQCCIRLIIETFNIIFKVCLSIHVHLTVVKAWSLPVVKAWSSLLSVAHMCWYHLNLLYIILVYYSIKHSFYIVDFGFSFDFDCTLSISELKLLKWIKSTKSIQFSDFLVL